MKTSSGWAPISYLIFPFISFFIPFSLCTLVYLVFCQFKKRNTILVNLPLFFSNLLIHFVFLILNSGSCDYGKIRDFNFIQRIITGQSCRDDIIQLWVPSMVVDILFSAHLFIYFVFIIYSCVSVWRKDNQVAQI